jgi:hypothetical protein
LGIVFVIVHNILFMVVNVKGIPVLTGVRFGRINLGTLTEFIACTIRIVGVIIFDTLVGAISRIINGATTVDIVVVVDSYAVVVLIPFVALTFGQSIDLIVVSAVFIMDFCTIPPTKHNIPVSRVPSLNPVNRLP